MRGRDNAPVRGDTESLVTEVVGEDLHGERVVSALVCTLARPWYKHLWYLTGESLWYLALIETRVLIISADRSDKPRGSDWRATRNSLAPRDDVVVEQFRRLGITGWSLHLNVRTQGRWVLHGFSLIPGIGFRFGQAKDIAEALGWQDQPASRLK